MKNSLKLMLLTVVIAAVTISCAVGLTIRSGSSSTPFAKSAPAPKKLPKLLDLGAGKCIPCKMMKPVLEELKKEYKGKLDVQYIDIVDNKDAAGKYKISVIPTQIFYDANGKEVARHSGFISKGEIVKKFKENKINLSK